MDNSVINWWEITLGQEEISGITNAIRNRCISMGKLTEEFESSIAGLLHVPYVVCVTSGTSALMVALMAAGVKPGDNVIVPDRTFIATAHAAMILGAKVRLVDSKSGKPVIDERLIEQKINKRTRAIIPVHINGHAADMGEIGNIGNKYGIPVIEDACQAFHSSSNGKYLGTLSRFGCFSLGLAKLVTTGQGGFIVCHNEEDYHTLKRIRNQGVFDVFRETNSGMVSGNFKFTDIQASIGLAQLSKIKEKLEHQTAVYTRYQEGLKGVNCLKGIDVNIHAGEIPLRPEFLCTERDRFITEINKFGINVVAHTHSLSELTYMDSRGAYPNSKNFHRNALIFPCGPNQPIGNIEKTIEAVKQISHKFKGW